MDGGGLAHRLLDIKPLLASRQFAGGLVAVEAVEDTPLLTDGVPDDSEFCRLRHVFVFDVAAFADADYVIYSARPAIMGKT